MKAWFLIAVVLAVFSAPSISHAAAHDPAWGPGGEWLAYYANPQGQFDVFVRMPSGAVNHVIANPSYDGSPQWRPEHGQWSFMSDRDGRFQLYLVNVDSGTVSRLTEQPGTITNHAWSSDGRYVAYENRVEGNADIWLMDTQDGTTRRVVADAASDFDPAFSPEDDRLVFQSNRSGRYQLHVLSLADGSVRALPEQEGHATGPFWAADGMIHFSQVLDDGCRLVRMNPENGDTTVIASFDLPALKPAVTPDGSRVAMFRMDPSSGGSDIVVVEVASGDVSCVTCQ